MKEKLNDVQIPTYLRAIEKKLEENEYNYFIVGKKYTIADFSLIAFYQMTKVFPQHFENILPNYPLLQNYFKKRLQDFEDYYKTKEIKYKLYYFDAPGRA